MRQLVLFKRSRAKTPEIIFSYEGGYYLNNIRPTLWNNIFIGLDKNKREVPIYRVKKGVYQLVTSFDLIT